MHWGRLPSYVPTVGLEANSGLRKVWTMGLPLYPRICRRELMRMHSLKRSVGPKGTSPLPDGP